MSDINIVLENRDDIRVAVEEKDINVEVPAGKDGRSLRPRGEWSASAAYAYLDLVSYEGSSYVATKAVPAGTLPTDTSYWMLSAEKGDPGTPVWGAITGDLSDQTDLADALLAKAPVILSSASGSIASFSDGSPAPVTALSVSIEPVQDLHGYDNPWPAGGGKNLLMPEIEWQGNNGITWTINADSSVTLSGTFINNTWSYQQQSIKPIEELGNVGDTVSFGTDIYIALEFLDSNSTRISIQATAGRVNVTIPEGTVYYRITIYPTNTITNIAGTTINKNTHYWLYKGPSDASTTWTPYSNICPISGHTSAVVTRTGKNLLNPTNVIDGYPSGTGISTSTGKSIYFPVVGGQTYTISKTGGTRFKVQYSVIDTVPAVGNNMVVDNVLFNDNSAMTATVTVPNNAKWIVAQIVYSGDDNKDAIVASCHVELGSSATAYEPYQGQTVTIDLDGTRYGGTFDVLTGLLTVDRGITAITSFTSKSTSTANNIYGNSLGAKPVSANTVKSDVIADKFKTLDYATVYSSDVVACSINTSGSFYAAFGLNGISTLADANAWVSQNPIQVVYPLATPLTVQLSPSQLSTLLGQNNIWADTGDTSVEYRADSKMYIDGKVAQTAKVTRQMIADSATADGKAPKSLATGDLIIVGDELRKATTNIGNGSAITASNSTIATLADVIKALQ